MTLNPEATALTTAATDGVLAVLCVGLIVWLWPCRRTWRRSVWLSLFALTGLASVLGTVAHGLDLTTRQIDVIWHPLYLALGLSVALFAVSAVADLWGAATGRRVLPWALAGGVTAYAVTELVGGAFIVFVVYEATVMLLVLASYVVLWRRGVPGAGVVASGVAVSIAAAAVQATTVELDLLVPVDHNGLFHLVQMVATVVLAVGVRTRLGDPVPEAVAPSRAWASRLTTTGGSSSTADAGDVRTRRSRRTSSRA